MSYFMHQYEVGVIADVIFNLENVKQKENEGLIEYSRKSFMTNLEDNST